MANNDDMAQQSSNIYLVTSSGPAKRPETASRPKTASDPRAPARTFRSLWFLCTLKHLTRQTTVMQLYLRLLREAFERKHAAQIVCNLKNILAITFDLDDTDPANLSRPEWSQQEFVMASNVRINRNLPSLPNGYDVMLNSTDRRHRLRVMMPDPGEPNDIALIIRYDGLMRFRTYETPLAKVEVLEPDGRGV
jgi:hypothetical protein